MIVVSPSASIVYRSDDNGTVLAFVATGTRIALVPQLALAFIELAREVCAELRAAG